MDTTATIDERDDAAMDLGDFDSALTSLIAVARDPDTPHVVANSCGTSIAEIWKRSDTFDASVFNALPDTAQAEIVGLLNLRKN
jgi:hypothetical protein